VDWRSRIQIDPKVAVGKPVVLGTRITVELVLDMLAVGVTETEILRNYPSLTLEAIRACVAYASDVVKSERTYRRSD